MINDGRLVRIGIYKDYEKQRDHPLAEPVGRAKIGTPRVKPKLQPSMAIGLKSLIHHPYMDKAGSYLIAELFRQQV